MNKVFDLLVVKSFISKEQFLAISEYQKLGLFSIRNELLFLLYISILLFTSGVGIIIYNNIDSIGHTVLLILLALLTVVCLFVCYKKSKGFSKNEVAFDNPLYDYLVLFTTILMCMFIGYFQYNLNFQKSNYSMATLVSASAALAMAYYFDNKSVLIIGITALGSFVGLTLKIEALFDSKSFNETSLVVAGILFGALLLLAQWLSQRYSFKDHFSFIMLTFGLHLLAMSCFAGCSVVNYWMIYLLILGVVLYYFYIKSINFKTVSWYVFVLFYGYIGLNILLFKVIYNLNLYQIFEFLTILTPFYVIGSIVLFIKFIKNFKNKTNVS